jgi:hypothetical protein
MILQGIDLRAKRRTRYDKDSPRQLMNPDPITTSDAIQADTTSAEGTPNNVRAACEPGRAELLPDRVGAPTDHDWLDRTWKPKSAAPIATGSSRCA